MKHIIYTNCMMLALLALIFASGCAGSDGELINLPTTNQLQPSINAANSGLLGPQEIMNSLVKTPAATELSLNGADFEAAFSQHVTAAASRAVFVPQWDRGADTPVAEAAYALYRFDTSSFTGPGQLRLNWHSMPVVSSTFYFGLANFTTNNWEWLTHPLNQSCSFDPAKNVLDDQLLFVALLIGNHVVDPELDTVTIGAPVYSIRGTVTHASGQPLGDVAITLSGAADEAVQTDEYGTFSFADLPDGNYTLTPAKSGWTFNPASQDVTVAGSDVDDVAFSGNAGTGAALSIELETAAYSNTSQTYGGTRVLGPNGYVGEYLEFDSGGFYEITVQASGQPAATSPSPWPRMTFSRNAVWLGDYEIVNDSYGGAFGQYTYYAQIDPGVHALAVMCIPDPQVPPTDGQLAILANRMEIRGMAGAALPTVSTLTAYNADGVLREDAVIALADSRIQQHRTGTALLTVLDASGIPVSGAEVNVELDNHEFLFGANLCGWNSGAQFKERFLNVFNFASAQVYWANYEPTEGNYNWSFTDNVANWAHTNSILVKATPLLWAFWFPDGGGGWAPLGVPDWCGGYPNIGSDDQQRTRVQDFISRYSGPDEPIDYFEVVNEPANRAWVIGGAARGYGLEDPHMWAQQADSDALLGTNDYYVFTNSCPDYYLIIEDALNSGVKMDYVGLQGHSGGWRFRFPMDRVWGVVDQYAKLGVPLHITEVLATKSAEGVLEHYTSGVWSEALQAEYCEDFFKVAFSHPELESVGWWDMSTQGAWDTSGGAALLNSDFSPREAYNRLDQLINVDWHTVASGTTDSGGGFSFAGYYGRYIVTVTVGGGDPEQHTAVFASDGSGEIIVQLAE